MSSCDDSAEMKELDESECDSDESGLICNDKAFGMRMASKSLKHRKQLFEKQLVRLDKRSKNRKERTTSTQSYVNDKITATKATHVVNRLKMSEFRSRRDIIKFSERRR